MTTAAWSIYFDFTVQIFYSLRVDVPPPRGKTGGTFPPIRFFLGKKWKAIFYLGLKDGAYLKQKQKKKANRYEMKKKNVAEKTNTYDICMKRVSLNGKSGHTSEVVVTQSV